MAKIELKDGRKIPMVTPTLWDSAQVERETGWDRKRYAAEMKLGSMQTALQIFASLRRAGIETTFTEVCDLELVANIVAEPRDLAREKETEGEQSPDPQASATAEAGASDPRSPVAPS